MSKARTLRLGAACVAIASTAVVTAPAAYADRIAGGTPEYCSGGAHGYVDISDNLYGTVRREALNEGGTRVTLETATIKGRVRGFAHLTGAQMTSDSVWLDVSADGGRNWEQCGPFVINTLTTRSKTSAAMITKADSKWVFRACGAINRATLKCSDWW
jgi:hypothetical protein